MQLGAINSVKVSNAVKNINFSSKSRGYEQDSEQDYEEKFEKANSRFKKAKADKKSIPSFLLSVGAVTAASFAIGAKCSGILPKNNKTLIELSNKIQSATTKGLDAIQDKLSASKHTSIQKTGELVKKVSEKVSAQDSSKVLQNTVGAASAVGGVVYANTFDGNGDNEADFTQTDVNGFVESAKGVVKAISSVVNFLG